MNSKFGISYNTTGAFWCSVILYFFIIFFIFFKLSRYEESIKYTNDKDAFMDVFVVESDISQSIKAPEQNEQKIEEFIIKKQVEPPLELKQEKTNKDIVAQKQDIASVNLSDLFSEGAPIDITTQTTKAV